MRRRRARRPAPHRDVREGADEPEREKAAKRYLDEYRARGEAEQRGEPHFGRLLSPRAGLAGARPSPSAAAAILASASLVPRSSWDLTYCCAKPGTPENPKSHDQRSAKKTPKKNRGMRIQAKPKKGHPNHQPEDCAP